MDIINDDFINKGSGLVMALFNSKNPNEIIKYSFLIIGFLFFVQGWDLTNIIIIVIIFLVLMLVAKTKNITLDDTITPKIKNIINKTASRLIPEIHIDESINKNIQTNVDKFKEEINKLTSYIIDLKNTFSDPSFLKILASIILHIKSYITEIGKIVSGIKNNLATSQPHLDFQNVKHIQNTLFEELDSLYFKLDISSDNKTHELLTNIKNIVKQITKQVQEYINEDFENNPNSNKGQVINDDEPQPFHL